MIFLNFHISWFNKGLVLYDRSFKLKRSLLERMSLPLFVICCDLISLLSFACLIECYYIFITTNILPFFTVSLFILCFLLIMNFFRFWFNKPLLLLYLEFSFPLLSKINFRFVNFYYQVLWLITLWWKFITTITVFIIT